MAYNRTRDFYIKKFGEDEGSKKFENVLRERKQREIRASNNISITLDETNLEEEVKNGNAVKCLECGYIATRLQWTHFKHKCTGRFKNGKEYMAVYPGAKVVAPNLAKSTVVTREKMILKYGNDIGEERWKSYCEKQAEVNTFEYKKEKYGWTEEQFDEYNQSRSVTLKNLIKRHGIEQGNEIWENYCERQRYTATLEYFIETYGEVDGKTKYEEWSVIRSKNGNGAVSQVETDFFNLFEKMNVVCGIRQYQFCGKTFDFVDTNNKLFIEFNGDYWHMNPQLYMAHEINTTTGKPAHEIWDRDAKKRNLLINEGYLCLVVWENDWRRDREETLRKTAEWWNSRIKRNKSLDQ